MRDVGVVVEDSAEGIGDVASGFTPEILQCRPAGPRGRPALETDLVPREFGFPRQGDWC